MVQRRTLRHGGGGHYGVVLALEPASPGLPEIVEEHVYLAGMPIAAVRALFSAGTGARTTVSSACAGMLHDIGSSVSCGTRFVFTEPVTGKIALITDSAARIVWTGEYQPMGARNRQEYWGGVHDTTKRVLCGTQYQTSYYCGNVTSGCTNAICGEPPTPALGQPGSHSALWPGYTGLLPIDQDIAVPTQLRAGLDMRIRVRFAHFDMEPGQDFVQIRNANNTVLFSATGFENGPVRTDWLPMSTDVFGVKFLAGSSATSNYPGKWFAGAHMEGYEWTRFTPGAEPFASPFGLYGMYYDEETEKYLNWHRFYDPFSGRYLSPEPLLQNPSHVRRMAQNGMAVPSYSYASDNPIVFVDPNGLAPIRNVTDLLVRYQQLRVSYLDWYLNTLRPTTSWGQALYARNWAFGQPWTTLPGSRGDPACGGAAASLAEHLRSNVDTEGVRIEEITAAWTAGSSGHTTVQIDMGSAV